MHTFIAVAAACLIAGLTVLPARTALAHGDVDEERLAQFELHLDDYQADVETLVAGIDPIVTAYADGAEVGPEIETLIETWEDVGVHAAIETRATITYPGVWQAIIGLQQAVAAGQPADAVAAAGKRLEAALWQGLGAVRLAASQVASDAAVGATDDPAPVSGPATIQSIIDDLERAVAAYRADDVRRAEALIHETYMSRFEGLEGVLIEHDPELVSGLEKDFNATLPLLMQEGAAMDRIQARVDAMKVQLAAASGILAEAEQSLSEVF